MLRTLRNENGIGLVSSMLALSLLALFAMVAAQLAVNESRTSQNDAWYTRAFHAADSGSESAIAWLTRQRGHSPITDFASRSVHNTAPESMEAGDGQIFAYDISYVRQRPRMGYEIGSFQDYVYDVASDGHAGPHGNSEIDVRIHKLTRTGYQAY